MVFYVGHGAYVGSYGGAGGGYTWLDRTNPCNGSGYLTYFEIYPQTTMSGLFVATYTKHTSGTTDYWINASWNIGSATGGSKQTFTGLMLNVITNDIIGIYYTSGTHYISSSGGSGDMYYVGNLTSSMVAGNEAIARANRGAGGFTYIDMVTTVPTAPSKMTTFEFYFAQASIGSVSVGIFTNNGGGSFTCTTSMALGAVSGLSKQTYTGFDFDVAIGQSIGVYGLGTYFVYYDYPTGWDSVYTLSGNHCTSEGAIGGYSGAQWQISLRGHNNLCRYVLESSVSSLSFSAASEPYSPPHISVPTLTTEAASSITKTSCIGNGTITDTGGENCARRGFCYMVGTTGNPTTANSVAYDDGSFGTGAYTKEISGLTKNTNYRVRAYANNSAGTGYGTTVQITTLNNIVNTKTVTDGVSLNATLKKFPKAVKSQAITLAGTIKKLPKLVKSQTLSLAASIKRVSMRVMREIPFSIDVGSIASDRGSYSTNAYTIIDLANVVNASGRLSTMELWFDSARPDATNVLCGTFYGSGLSYTRREYVSIGAVTKGSKQTFSGLSCAARIGDVIGVYYDTGGIETDISGGSGIVLKAGNMFNQGTQVYDSGANYAMSAYAYGLSTYNVDVVNRRDYTKRVDSASLSVNATKRDLKIYVLGINNAEKFVRRGLRQFNDAITNGGSIKKVVLAVKNQSISMLDVLGRYYQRVMVLETEVLSGVVSTNKGMYLVETISLSASLIRAAIRKMIDIVVNDESNHFIMTKLLEDDMITMAGNMFRGYFLVARDSITLSERITRQCGVMIEQIVYMLIAGGENILLSSIGEDVYISSTSTTWEQARLGDNLSIDRSVLLSYITSMHKTGSDYMLGNSLLYFDTRYIPPDAELISAKIKIYSSYATIVESFDVVIQNGQPTCPHVPAVLDDYYPSNYSGNGGSKSAIGWIGSGWNEINLNATGLLWIKKGEITKLSVMSSSMMNDVQPAADYENIIAFYDCHDEGYEGLLPILEVEYRVNGGGVAKAISAVKNDVVSILMQFAAYYPRVLSEMVQMSDGIVKKIGAVRSQTVSMLGSVVKLINVMKSQSMSVSDKMEKSRALTFTQTIGLAEAITKSVSAVKKQAVSMIGIVLKFTSTAKTQSVSISDKLVKKATGVKLEEISITGYIRRAISGVKLQVITNIGSMKKKLSRLLSGSIALSSSFRIGAFYSSVRSEVVQLSESITKRVVVTKTDVLVFVDRVYKSLFRQVGDSMDLVTFVFIPKLRILVESITVTESMKKVTKKLGAYSISMVETFEAKQILRTFVIGLYRTLKFLGF